MKTISLILLSSLVAGTAHAGSSFSLEERGDVVCRVSGDSPDRCMPSLKSLQLYDRDSMELTDQLRSYMQFLEAKKSDPQAQVTQDIGASMLLSEAEVKKTLENWPELSVRMMSVDPKAHAKVDGRILIPFQASLRWKGKAGMNGTIYVEGKLSFDEVNNELNPEVGKGREHIRQFYKVENFSDSTTEQKKDFLRFLETGARTMQFKIIGTDGLSVDEATLALINDTVAPMVYGELMSHLLVGGLKKALP